MWTDISQFDIPEHQKTASYGSGKEDKFTDIGEVCVVNSMFGKAKIRVIHPRKKRNVIWPLATLVLSGIAAMVWLEQDLEKPPEPMRIIVRSVDSEGAVQANSQKLPVALPTARNVPTPAAPTESKPTPELNTKAAIVVKPRAAQPALPLVKSDTAATVPAAKPLMPVKPPATIQSPVQPVAGQAAATVIGNEQTIAAPVAEPLTENTKAVAPSSNDPPPDQTITQPN